MCLSRRHASFPPACCGRNTSRSPSSIHPITVKTMRWLGGVELSVPYDCSRNVTTANRGAHTIADGDFTPARAGGFWGCCEGLAQSACCLGARQMWRPRVTLPGTPAAPGAWRAPRADAWPGTSGWHLRASRPYCVGRALLQTHDTSHSSCPLRCRRGPNRFRTPSSRLWLHQRRQQSKQAHDLTGAEGQAGGHVVE
jgi:hypothetical protein